jgi:hypothetical protein
VPPKVNIFIWKLCRDALPTKKCKAVRRMEVEDVCDLCGLEAETGFHPTVVCPQAYNLRQVMRHRRNLPNENMFCWLLLLLDRCTKEQRDLTKLLLWRAWSVHNNITHQADPTSITDSEHFLLALVKSLQEDRQHDTVKSKGKRNCGVSDNGKEMVTDPKLSPGPTAWVCPPDDWIKINVDGSFVEQTGEAGVGVIARNSKGEVIFSAWRVLFR